MPPKNQPKKKGKQPSNESSQGNDSDSDVEVPPKIPTERLYRIKNTVNAALTKDNRQIIAKILGKDGIKYGQKAQEQMRRLWATLSEFIALVEHAETDVRDQSFYIETKIEVLRMCAEQRGHWKIIPVEQNCPFTGKLEIIPCCVYGIRKNELGFLTHQADSMAEALRTRILKENNLDDYETASDTENDENPCKDSEPAPSVVSDGPSFVVIEDDTTHHEVANDTKHDDYLSENSFDSIDSTYLESMGLRESSPRKDTPSPPTLEEIPKPIKPVGRKTLPGPSNMSFLGHISSRTTPAAPSKAKTPSENRRKEMLDARATGLEKIIGEEIVSQREYESRAAALWSKRANSKEALAKIKNISDQTKRVLKGTPPRPKRARTNKTTEIRQLTRALQSCLTEVKREQQELAKQRENHQIEKGTLQRAENSRRTPNRVIAVTSVRKTRAHSK